VNTESIGIAYANYAQQCGASCYRSAIYVSFASGTAHDHAMAVLTAHELSHALWEKLEGVPLDEDWQGSVRRLTPAEREEFRLLVEG
jgi:hypothetical protein